MRVSNFRLLDLQPLDEEGNNVVW